MTPDQYRLNSSLTTDCSIKVGRKSHTRGTILEELEVFASSVSDFHRTNNGNIRHSLADIIMLMVPGRAGGCVERAEIIEFGRHNLNKIRNIGMLKNGVPSEATLCRVENGIDAPGMAEKMRDFSEMFRSELYKSEQGREIICIDGNAERGTIQENGRNPDIVSAYSFNTGITLATVTCKEKSNEIKTVPVLINMIDISGKIVNAYAMSMQKDIISKIRKNGGSRLFP